MFSCEYSEIFKNSFFIEHHVFYITPVGVSAFFLKGMKQVNLKGVNLNRFFKKCPCYDVLIIFSSQDILETSFLMYKKSNSFVYKFVVNFQVF